MAPSPIRAHSQTRALVVVAPRNAYSTAISLLTATGSLSQLSVVGGGRSPAAFLAACAAACFGNIIFFTGAGAGAPASGDLALAASAAAPDAVAAEVVAFFGDGGGAREVLSA